MINDEMNSCVIRKVRNGFIVDPDVVVERHACTPASKTSVFTTFDGLFSYLKECFCFAEPTIGPEV